MRLFTGVLCLCIAVFVYYVTLLGCRNPRRPKWASDFLVGNVYATGMVAVGVYGFADLVRFAFDFDQTGLPLQQVWMAGATLVAAFVAVKALRVQKTLAEYAAAARKDDERPEPPVKPIRPRLAA